MGIFIGFFSIVFALFIVIGYLFNDYSGLLTSIVRPIFIAGTILVANDILLNKKPGFSRFFDGFEFFLPLILLNIITGVLIVVGLFFIIVPGIYLAIGYSMANMFIIFFGYDVWVAMELSRKIIHKNWWNFFGFFIVLTLINIAGIFAFGVGILFTAPLTTCITYSAFEDIVGGAIRKHSQNEEINEQHDYETNIN